MIKYFGGQHSIYVSPKTLATYYTDAKPNCAPIPSPNSNPNQIPTANPNPNPNPNPIPNPRPNPNPNPTAGIIDGSKLHWTPYDRRDFSKKPE